MEMDARLGPEVLDLIIDELEGSISTLCTISLVSSHCASRARRHIFKHVNLGHEEGSPPYDEDDAGEDGDDEPEDTQSTRFSDFLELLETNEMLGSYVHSLSIRMSSFIGREDYEDDEDFIDNLPLLLELLPSLSSIRMIAPEIGDVSDWKSMPHQVKEAITDCCGRANIRKVAIIGFWNVPYQLVFSAPKLEVLDLTMVSPSTDTAAFGSATPGPNRSTGLIELVAHSSSTFIRPLVLASPKMLSSLKTLQLDLGGTEDWDTYRRILRVCRASLQRIVLEVQVQPVGTEDRMPPLPNSKNLKLIVPAIPDWRRTHVYFPEYAINSMKSTLLLHEKTLETLELLTLTVSLRTTTFKVNPSVTILEDTTGAWAEVDECLSSIPNGKLQIELNFEILASTEGGVDHHDKMEVISQLSEKAATLLPKTTQAGRLNTFVHVLSLEEYKAQDNS